MSKRILITGAGGFIGGYLVAEALKRGYDTWAAVRATTSREFLTDERIHFLELDFTDEQALAAEEEAANLAFNLSRKIIRKTKTAIHGIHAGQRDPELIDSISSWSALN